jgi:F-type H+-transporting ATPase subunit b
MPALLLPFASEGDFLIRVSPGLMIWTLLIFAITLYLLKRLAFGRIADAIDERRRVVRENLESAEKARDEAQKLLEDYRKQLAEARREASEIVERSRRTGDALRRQMQEDVSAAREKGLRDAQESIRAETRQALDQIKNEVADLTLLATEKVVGRALGEAEQRQLIEQALAEVDFSRLAAEVEEDR